MPRPRSPLRLGIAFPGLLALATACGGEPTTTTIAPPPPATAAAFEDVAKETGLDFVHWNGMTGRWYFAEMMGAGGALFDYDGDGDLDVYLVQGNLLGEGARVEDAVFPPPGPLPLTDRLYRNELEELPDGRRVLRFTDVSEESGIAAIFRARPSYGMGVAAADLDGDGWIDLYLTALEENRLLQNRGDGTFADVTAASGTGERRWSVPVAVADLDQDGLLDLYVGNYVAYGTASDKRCSDELGGPNYCGPLSYPPLPDTLYRNRGGMRFEDVSHAAGIDRLAGAALGVQALDVDGDGRLEIAVGNDGTPNVLWRRRPDGTFEDLAVERGVAVDGAGAAEATMGMASADVDGDGDEDLFTTALTRETNTLAVNDGGFFSDATARLGLAAPSFEMTAFGAAWVDFDADSDLDLFVANGAVKVIKSLVVRGDRYPLHQPNQLFERRGEAFVDRSGDAGPAFALSEVSRGVAAGDVDEDGDLDLLVTQNSAPVRLLLDRAADGKPWLGVRLLDASGRRDALGAWAELRRGGRRVASRRVATAGSYASSSDPRLLFALGEDRSPVDALDVRWPDGRRERFPGERLAAGAYTALRQGSGEPIPNESP